MKKSLIYVVLLSLLLGLCPVAFAQPIAEQATITTTGSGAVKTLPDCALLWLGVSETDKDVSSAQRRVNKRVNRVREVMIENGVDKADIALGELSMYTRYDYDSGTETIAGYNVSHQLQITVRDLDALGGLIDKALDAGANQLNGVNFILENSAAAYQDALTLAVKDARAKAEIIAKAEGLTLSTVLEMKENANAYGGQYAESEKGGSGDMSGTQVDVSKLSIGASVTVVFAAK